MEANIDIVASYILDIKKKISRLTLTIFNLI